jgi:hypothetical protein
MLVEFSRAFFVCTESELEWIFSQLDLVREILELNSKKRLTLEHDVYEK